MNRSRTPSSRRSRCHRRGVSVVMILGLITSVLALSYFVMRTQAITAQLHDNAELNASARQAAQTAVSIALRKMHDSAWGGISATVSGSMGSSQTYFASYAPGDPNLATTDANAADWPYRVTIDATGFASDPARPTVSASYKIRAVVKLLPRQTPTNPSVFSSALSYTIYQTDDDDFEIQVPSQIKGNVRLQGTVVLADNYPSSASKSRYFSDLNAMRSHGYIDARPLTGTVNLPNSQTPGSTRNLLSNELGLTLNNISSTTASGWSYPGTISNYRLYPGGPSYNVQAIGSSLSNTTLAADPRTNPLGVFTRSGSVTIGSNVTIRGTLIVGGDVQINGTNIVLEAPDGLPLAGTSDPVQLPAIVVWDDLSVGSGASVSVNGLVAVFDQFIVQTGTVDTSLQLKGHVICDGFAIQDRNEFSLSAMLWSILWSAFNTQLSPATSSTVPYLPVWMAYLGLPYAPALTLEPQTTSVRYVWKDASNTPYIHNTSDPGLKLTLVSWVEGI